MQCKEKTYLLIKRPGETQEYNTRFGDKVILDTNSNSLDVVFDAQAYNDWLAEKVRMTVYIPRWLRHSLIQYIETKYGGDVPHGALSEAVTELLAEALARASSRPKDNKRVGRDQNREECERILAMLKTFIVPGIQPGSQISFTLLARAITLARGRKETKHGLGIKADPRTIKRWIGRLKELGYIAETETSTYAILWVPDEERCRELLGDLWHLAQR